MLDRQQMDPALYRDAMSRFAGHVQLVTTVLGKERRGVTITAACSVSDNPATVLICLNNSNAKNEIFFRSGIFVLNTLGFPTVQNGSGIISAETIGHPAGSLFSVDVADPCSGIRSLFALMMVSALYANFTLKSPWKRLALFACSIPIALAGNIFRILLLTIGIITLGSPVAIGTLEHPSWFHEGAGFAVFIVALFGMLLLGKLLNSSPSKWRGKWQAVASSVKSPAENPREKAPPSDLY